MCVCLPPQARLDWQTDSACVILRPPHRHTHAHTHFLLHKRPCAFFSFPSSPCVPLRVCCPRPIPMQSLVIIPFPVPLSLQHPFDPPFPCPSLPFHLCVQAFQHTHNPSVFLCVCRVPPQWSTLVSNAPVTNFFAPLPPRVKMIKSFRRVRPPAPHLPSQRCVCAGGGGGAPAARGGDSDPTPFFPLSRAADVPHHQGQHQLP